MHAVVAEKLAHRAAGKGRKKLHRGRVGSGGGDDNRVFERAVLLQNLGELSDCRTLLPNRDIDAVELLRLVVALVQRLLIKNRVQGDRGLARLPIPNDELALSATDRNHTVDRLKAGRHRLAHRLARYDAGRLDIDAGAFVSVDRTLAVNRIAQSINDAAEKPLADRHVDDRAGALHRLAFLDLAVSAENDDADIVALEVERHAARAVLEFDHFACLNLVETVGARDPVADAQHLSNFGDVCFSAEVGDLSLEDRGNFCGADIHQPTSFMAMRIALSLVFSEPSTMREPSLTIKPPMIEGSTFMSRSISRPPEAVRSESLSEATLASVKALALVTSARVTPRALSYSLR